MCTAQGGGCSVISCTCWPLALCIHLQAPVGHPWGGPGRLVTLDRKRVISWQGEAEITEWGYRNTGNKLISNQALCVPLRISSTALFTKVGTLLWGWAVCWAGWIHCLKAPSSPWESLSHSHFLPIKDTEAALSKRLSFSAWIFSIYPPRRKLVKRTHRLSKFPEIWRLLPATRVDFFARAWGQLCFAEVALAEILQEENPLCLWTSTLLPKCHSSTCQHLN